MDIDFIEVVIKKGMKWRDREKPTKWYANMHGCEVVFEELEDTLYIITVYPAETKQ